MQHIYIFKNNSHTLFNNLSASPFPSILYCFLLSIRMTTAVPNFNTWTSILDGLPITKINFGSMVVCLISTNISKNIPISTFYFIQNVSLISLIFNQICVVGEEGGCAQ